MHKIAPGTAGIYCIRNVLTKDLYIGSSNNVPSRLRAHKNRLRKGKHHAKRMQEDWSRLGEAYFEFFLMSEEQPDGLLDAEQFFIGGMTAGYNTVRNVHRYEVTEHHKDRLKALHRAKHRTIEAFGQVWSMKDLAETYGVKYTLLKDRLRAGWDAEKAVLQPTGERKSNPEPKEVSAFGVTDTLAGLHRRFSVVPWATFYTRVRRGWGIEEALGTEKVADGAKRD